MIKNHLGPFPVAIIPLIANHLWDGHQVPGMDMEIPSDNGLLMFVKYSNSST